MKQVLITVAEKPTKDYPFAVVVVDTDLHPNSKGQENLCKTVREAYIFANGLCYGVRILGGDKSFPINPELDSRLQRPE